MSPVDSAPTNDRLDDLLIDAALGLIEREGWLDLTMGRFARAAGVPLSELYKRQTGKPDLLRALIRRVDLAALKDGPMSDPDAEPEMPRDRLFDAVMLRFEALEPHRAAMRVLARELPRDPVTVAAIRGDMLRSLAWTLDAADLSPNGLGGAVRVRLLGLICWRTLQVWLEDDGRDLARTMADLDRRLRQSGRWLGLDKTPTGASREGEAPVSDDAMSAA